MSYIFVMYDKPSSCEERCALELSENEEFIDNWNNRQLLDFSFGITMNYTKMIDPLFDDALKAIYNKETDEVYSTYFTDKTGEYMKPLITYIINRIGNEKIDDDYFKCTKGNCLAAMKTLLKMCEMHPEGYFNVV